jgi:hypothetical protein
VTLQESAIREINPMRDPSVWEDISIAPFDHEIEVAVVEGDSLHALVFACRRILCGWINAQTNQRVTINPTHWRSWAENH